MVNYYSVLGVSADASQAAIRSAYRRLAQVYHPDRGGSHERMARLNEAYEVLSDHGLRATYDAAQRPQTSPQPPAAPAERGPVPPTSARSPDSQGASVHKGPIVKDKAWKDWVAGVPAASIALWGLARMVVSWSSPWDFIFAAIDALICYGIAVGTYLGLRTLLGR